MRCIGILACLLVSFDRGFGAFQNGRRLSARPVCSKPQRRLRIGRLAPGVCDRSTLLLTLQRHEESNRSDCSLSSSSSSSIDSNATASDNLDESVESLRQRAQQLRLEANALERALSATRQGQGKLKQSSAQALYDRLFLNPAITLTAHGIANTFQQNRWSVEQAAQILELLYKERQRHAPDMAQAAKTTTFHIGDTDNAAPVRNDTHVAIVDERIQRLFAAAEIMDNAQDMSSATTTKADNPSLVASAARQRWSDRGVQALKSRWAELQRADEKEYERQQLLTGLNGVMSTNSGNASSSTSPTSLQQYMRATLGLPLSSDNPRSFNMSRVMERVSMIPAWLPSPLLPYIAAANAVLDKDDIKRIKDRVLTGSGFFVTSSDAIPSAAIYRGNIRVPGMVDPSQIGAASADVFEEIQRRMDVECLSDRVQLFLLEDQAPSERDIRARPVILALSKQMQPDDRLLKQAPVTKSLKGASFALTTLTTFAYSITCLALNPMFFDAIMNQGDARALAWCLPVFVGVVALQAVSEGARWLVANHRKVKIGPPLPLPCSQIGTFGCSTPLRSFPPNRSTMVEFALASPLTCFVLSTALLVIGIVQTIKSPEVALVSLPYIPVAVLKSSFFVSSILTFLAPKLMSLPLAQPVPMHPLFVVGFAGIIAASLNMLPIFRLDGGRACTAALGNRVGAIASVSSLMFLLSVSLSSETGLGLAWCMIIALFRRKFDIPARNEITPVDKVRLGASAAGIVGALLVLLPFPGASSIL